MKHTTLLLLLFPLSPFFSHAQDTVNKVFALREIFDLVIQNNQSLKISRLALDIRKQETDVIKLRRLPSASLSVTGGYIGDALILDKDFSEATNVPMPHYGNSFSVQASQTVFKGDLIHNSIAQASLREQIAYLVLKENKVDTKLLVAGNYLDLYKLYNQKRVYERNISLAELRIRNIRKLYQGGVVTRNDVIRSELQVADLKLAVRSITNDIRIINRQLTVATGLPDFIRILPDTSLLTRQIATGSLDRYQMRALEENPSIQAADLRADVADKSLLITKAGRLPSLAVYAGNHLQRPITSSAPAIDKYSNGWEVGLSLSYDIASLYQIPEKIRLNKLQVRQAKAQAILVRQSKEVKVNAAYLRHQEALLQEETLRENVRLANENYRITEKKYLNQLALLIDMLDASSAKLEAELRHTNAHITTLYTYYQLLAEIGSI